MTLHSKVHKPHATQRVLVQVVIRIDTSAHWTSLVVEEVVVRHAIAGAEFLLLEEEGVVHERQGIEDVELGKLCNN